MEEKNNNENKKIKTIVKNNNKLIIICVLALAIILGVLGLNAYAKFVATRGGSASAQIAKLVCEIDVGTPVDGVDIINPYCNITVKNNKIEKENGADVTKVTQTDVNYTVEIECTDPLPEYYWQDEEDNIIRYKPEENTSYVPITGTFTKNAQGQYVAEEHTYRIVFVNPGESVNTKNIKFNLVAVQPER